MIDILIHYLFASDRGHQKVSFKSYTYSYWYIIQSGFIICVGSIFILFLMYF